MFSLCLQRGYETALAFHLLTTAMKNKISSHLTGHGKASSFDDRWRLEDSSRQAALNFDIEFDLILNPDLELSDSKRPSPSCWQLTHILFGSMGEWGRRIVQVSTAVVSLGVKLNFWGLLKDSSMPMTLDSGAQWEHDSPGTTKFMALWQNQREWLTS